MRFKGFSLSRLAVLVGLVLGVMAAPAHAYWRGGVVVGVPFGPFFVPPPLFIGPPVVYSPPPVVFAPQPPIVYAAPPPPPSAGQSCVAGPYVCPLTGPANIGASCSCPSNQGNRVFGAVH